MQMNLYKDAFGCFLNHTNQKHNWILWEMGLNCLTSFSTSNHSKHVWVLNFEFSISLACLFWVVALHLPHTHKIRIFNMPCLLHVKIVQIGCQSYIDKSSRRMFSRTKMQATQSLVLTHRAQILCEHFAIITKSCVQLHPPFLVCCVIVVPGLLPIYLHGCKIKSANNLGMA